MKALLCHSFRREVRLMAEKNAYVGKISSGAVQDIKAPYAKASTQKGAKIIKGGDLRANKSKG